MKKEMLGLSLAVLLTGCGPRGEATRAYQLYIQPGQRVTSNDINIGTGQEIILHVYTNQWDSNDMTLLHVTDTQEVPALYSSSETDEHGIFGYHIITIVMIPKPQYDSRFEFGPRHGGGFVPPGHARGRAQLGLRGSTWTRIRTLFPRPRCNHAPALPAAVLADETRLAAPLPVLLVQP